jgi:hypothetical protein
MTRSEAEEAVERYGKALDAATPELAHLPRPVALSLLVDTKVVGFRSFPLRSTVDLKSSKLR